MHNHVFVGIRGRNMPLGGHGLTWDDNTKTNSAKHFSEIVDWIKEDQRSV